MLVCPECGQHYEPSTAVIHYEDTDYLCDACLARMLGIAVDEKANEETTR